MFFFFFFKQKTAYEMRISDWSSDVCSSDLFSYSRAETLDDAFRIFAAADGEAKYLAGGQTLGPMLNLRLTQPDALIDIARVAELRRAEERPSSIVLGAAVRHAEIEDGLVPDASNGLPRIGIASCREGVGQYV